MGVRVRHLGEVLVDRFNRIPILSFSIVLWSIASLWGAFSHSYEKLLVTRPALGAVTATAGPGIASLTGDSFRARERGRVYAYIRGGETAGEAAGYIGGGSVTGAISWPAAHSAHSPRLLPGPLALADGPERLRGGQSKLERRVIDLDEAIARARSAADQPGGADDDTPEADELAREPARQRGVPPDPGLVLDEDPQRMGLGVIYRPRPEPRDRAQSRAQTIAPPAVSGPQRVPDRSRRRVMIRAGATTTAPRPAQRW
jgi:Major Facilitator Superfamily